MAISYDEYINKNKKKKKKEEPKVVLGYSPNQNNVKNTPRSTTDTQTLIDRYIAEQKNKKTVAPVKKKEGDGLFSAFEDGYQMGDVSKTILKGGKKLGKAVYKTGKEIVTNPVESFKAGMVGIGEGINKANDLTNDAVEDFFDFITGRKKEDKDLSVSIIDIDRFSKTASEEEKQKVLKEYEKKYGKDSQLYKSVELSLNTKGKKEDTNVLNMKYYDTDTYEKAVEGKLSEGQQNIYNIGQTVGNIVPATVVSAVLSPAVGKALFFTQAQQGYTEEALARGYDEKDARIYGMIMGGFEVAVERLGFDELGGFKGLAKGNIIKNMVGEGMEEFVMPYIDDVVTYVGFEDGYGWEEFRESSEEALEGAVMGAVVGGIFSAGGKGLAKVDKVIQKATNGETITQYELIEARDQLQEHSPETLQEAIVGVAEQLKKNKSVGGKQEEVQDVTSEDIAPVPNETDIIENLQENNIPILEGNEYQQASTTETTVEADETVLKSQNYVYQASETDSEYRRNLNEDATKYANNTTRTHEFVNTLANVSEASGLNIRLTNNTSPEMTQRKQAMINSYAKRNNVSVQEASERLKNIVIDGYNVNDQITINVNSPKALNRLVGHEITHSLEKTVVYKTKLQKIAIDYAKSKNDYKSRLDRLIDLYEGQNADINKELTADIIGDYLFTDQKFVDNLYKKDRNLFQRIYDEIKHLFKMATAGSKEARELEKLKHSFEKAMRENKEMSKESKKATVQETKDKSAVEVESNTQEKEDSVQKTEKEEYSLSEELENNLEKVMQSKKDQIDFFEDYLEENDIKNPTEKDMYDSWGTYEQFDADADNYLEAEKEYYKTIREYLDELSKVNKDSEGNKLSEAQIEFFKDSKVRDENGNLLVMYHGTRGEFYTFDLGKAGQNYEGGWSMSGRGFYFASDFKEAKEYAGASVNDGDIIIKEVYLNMTNPFYTFEDYTKELAHIKEKYNIDDLSLKAGYRLIDVLNQHGFDSTTVLKELGFDGVIEGARNDKIDQVMVFESNQIKDIDNKKPTEDSDIRYSLTRASDEQIQQATELEKQDKTPEEIYLETGAYRGSEGLWRTEIDDSRATIKISSSMVGGKYKLSDILDFPKLYKAYPEFKYMTVIFDNNMLPNKLGSYSPEIDEITINSSIYDYKQAELLSAKKQLADWDNTVKTYEVLFSGEQIEQQLETLKDRAKQYKRKDYQKQLKSTLLHELQHVIQETEGFTSGANPSYWQRKQDIAETYRDAYRERENELYKKMNMDKFYDDMWGKIQDMTWEEFQQAKEDYIDNSEYSQEYRDLQEIKEKNAKRYEILTGRSAYELYRDTAGEQEARNVQERMDMSNKQRKETMPFAGNRETVFYEGSYNEEKYGVFLNQTEDVSYSLSNTGEMVDNQGNKVTLEASETGSTRNLMAIHNLDEGKLRGVMELGGFPVPSIAIIDTNKMAHNQFGGISVLFDKETINPANPKNEVYDRDVWTPTFPRVEYDIDNESLRKLIKDNNIYNDHKNPIASRVLSRYFTATNLEYDVNGNGADDALEMMKKNNSLMYLYQKTTNPNFKDSMKPTKYSNDYSNASLQRFIDSYKGDMELPDFYYHYLNYGDMQLTEDEIKTLKEQIKQAITPEIKETAEQWVGKYEVDPEKAEKMRKILIEEELKTFDESYFKYKDFVKDASRLYEFGETESIDEYMTLEMATRETNKEEYYKWLDKVFGDYFKTLEKGIRNDKDPFTPSGNRRNFKSLHDPYTLESVVKYITSQKTVAGEEGFGAGSGFGTIQAQMSHKFDSIDEIRQYGKEKLTTREESADVLKPLADNIYEDMSLLGDYLAFDSGYSTEGLNNSGYALNDFAGYKTQNITNLKRALDNNNIDSSKVPTELLQKVVDDINALKNIPTDYFEAKPQRAVGLDEVQAVVIPNDVSAEFKQQLQDAGLTYYEYDRSIEGDRQRVINQFDELKFSLSRTDDIAPVGENDIFGSDIAVQEQVKEAIAPLQEQIETLTKTISDLQENMAPASFDLAEEQRAETQRTMTDEDAPLTDEGTFSFLDEEVKVKKKQEIINDIASDFNIKKTEARELYNKIESIPEVTIDDVYTELENYRKVKFKEQDDYVKSIQDYIRGTKLDISNIKKQIPDYGNVYRMSNMGKGLILGNSGQGVDTFYQELNELFPNEFPSDVVAEADQLELISQAMYKEKEFTYVDILDDDELQILAERIYTDIGNSERYKHTQSGLYFLNREVKKMAPPGEINTDISEEEYADSLTTLDASNTEQVEETVSLEEELNELDRQKGPSIKKNPFDEVLDKFLEGQRPGKTTATPKVEKTKYENFRDTTQRLFVNEMVESDNLAKESGNLNIKYTGDMLNNVAGEIEGEIYTAQTDNEGHQIGKSLSALFSEAKKTGLYDAFNDYLEQYSNIDRHAQGKGSVVPLADSQRLVRHYEKTYPEFKQWGKGVWQYGANIRNNLIDAGIINEEFAETLGSMYPHYVPYMENREMTNYNPDLGEIKPKGVIKRAKGGADNLLPIEDALTKYTFASKKAVRQNQFYQEIVATLDSKAEVGADVRSDALDLEDTLYRDETGNYLTAYFDGERLSVRISDDLYTGLRNDLKGQIKGLEEKFALITDPVQKLSEWRRNLLTSWNPMFIIKNPIMDVQDALFNSKYTKDFAKNYPRAFVELGQAKSETAKQFLTLYGSGNVMGEYSSDGSVKSNKFLRGIERANNIMELAPRYAEFKASLENGASLQEAMYNAREVTTNFGRGGVITKALNKNGFTFLNVSVQGFDKFIRNFSGENGAKGVTGALLKATLLGVVPAVFNELAFGGDDEEKDEDYDALPDYIKDNYYLIKTGDGQFIRIPKGRILSVFGSAGRRTIEYLQGEEDAFEGYLKNANSQVGVSNPLDSNILTPLFQAFGSENGEAWYGGDIVPTRLQSKAPREQYDASTDKFSIWLGDKIGVSPYKINYVIDQYSGGMGDIFLPFITEESTSDAEGIELALAPIKDQFTANSTFDNKYAGDIYDLSDKMDKMPSNVKETDEYKIQDAYLYSVTSEMGKLYAERRAVQEDKKLSKKEKYEKVQEIQKQINALAKEGLDNYEDVNSTSNYAIVGGREFNKYKTESGETRWGAVREDELEALNSYGLDIMEKSSYFNAKTYISQAQEKYKNTEDYTQKKRDIIAVIKSTLLTDEAKAYLYDKYYADTETLNAITSLGIDFDKYLDLEYQNFEADKNSAGKSISGSKKAKVFRYINSMDLSFEEKLVLTKLQYNSYNEYNGEVINYINNSDLTYEQRVNILKKLGFKVDDYGNIFW